MPSVSTCLHISKALERAGKFDLIHNNSEDLPFIRTPM
jgi:hypothetical protein